MIRHQATEPVRIDLGVILSYLGARVPVTPFNA
jgi:hypothetical protein